MKLNRKMESLFVKAVMRGQWFPTLNEVFTLNLLEQRVASDYVDRSGTSEMNCCVVY